MTTREEVTMPWAPEEVVQHDIVWYIRMQYRSAMFQANILSGAVKLSNYVAVKMKALGAPKGYPDLMIFEPRLPYYGCFLELKAPGTELYLARPKGGRVYASEHIALQAEIIAGLRKRGYYANFAIGFDDAKMQIDNYMKPRK